MEMKDFRSIPPEVFLGKFVSKICCKFTREHPCRNVISIKLLCKTLRNKTLWHGCSPVNLLQIFKLRFSKNTSRRLLLRFSFILPYYFIFLHSHFFVPLVKKTSYLSLTKKSQLILTNPYFILSEFSDMFLLSIFKF